ncbi:hypothetical protein NPIL_469631 [Nephila pilipes]|uniref:Uncharacterized protein n=1 Tax=Nephila pilipes TaxID=299642 RepID=A0A8X6NGQ4_NEPPI|nr:hypothetical protein NPIL_469631 [Nephila pilipes]
MFPLSVCHMPSDCLSKILLNASQTVISANRRLCPDKLNVPLYKTVFGRTLGSSADPVSMEAVVQKRMRRLDLENPRRDSNTFRNQIKQQ